MDNFKNALLPIKVYLTILVYKKISVFAFIISILTFEFFTCLDLEAQIVSGIASGVFNHPVGANYINFNDSIVWGTPIGPGSRSRLSFNGLPFSNIPISTNFALGTVSFKNTVISEAGKFLNVVVLDVPVQFTTPVNFTENLAVTIQIVNTPNTGSNPDDFIFSQQKTYKNIYQFNGVSYSLTVLPFRLHVEEGNERTKVLLARITGDDCACSTWNTALDNIISIILPPGIRNDPNTVKLDPIRDNLNNELRVNWEPPTSYYVCDLPFPVPNPYREFDDLLQRYRVHFVKNGVDKVIGECNWSDGVNFLTVWYRGKEFSRGNIDCFKKIVWENWDQYRGFDTHPPAGFRNICHTFSLKEFYSCDPGPCGLLGINKYCEEGDDNCNGKKDVIQYTTNVCDINYPIIEQIQKNSPGTLLSIDTIFSGEAPPSVKEDSVQNFSGLAKPCDINHDSVCDSLDLVEFNIGLGHCLGDSLYNPLTDINDDGCVTVADSIILFDTTIIATATIIAHCKDVQCEISIGGSTDLLPSMVENNSYSKFGIDSVFISKYRFYCSDVGIDTVQLWVIDSLGNESTCESRVTVIALPSSNCYTANAQAPFKQWDRRFGGSGYEESGFGLEQTNDGAYILAGYSASGSTGDRSQSSHGSNDFWIVKVDTNGNKIWDKSFGGTGDDRPRDLQKTNDGGYILAGRSTSGISGDKTQFSQGGDDMWIVKTDLNGIKQWDKRFGGNRGDDCLAIRQTNDGGYILGGASVSDASGDKTQPLLGDQDYWIVKTDSMGLKQWDVRFGGNDISDEVCTSIQLTVDDGFIFGGFSASDSSGDKSQQSQGGNDFWVIKTNSSGIKQWDKCFGGSGDDQLYSILGTSDGGFILAGFSNSDSSGDKTENSNGLYDYWIVKIDANGLKQWDKSFGGDGSDKGRSLYKTNDGGYVMGGWSNSGISGDRSESNQGSDDYWIVKLDSMGNKQWDARFGGSDRDQLNSVQQTIDGGYILSGNTYSTISGDKSQTSRGSQDYWIIKLGNAGATQTCTNPYIDNIISWWPFDDTSNTYVNDIIRNDTGMFFYGANVTEGIVGNAAQFNGIGFVQIADDSLWSFGTNNFTIEFWANFNSPPGGSIGGPGVVFIGCDEGGGGVNKWFFALGDNKLHFHINGPGSTSLGFFNQTPFDPILDQWYHIALTRSSDTLKIFVDGELLGVEVINNLFVPNPSAPLTIGQAEGLGYMNGMIDEMTIYNRALSEAEILTIANAQSAGKCKNPEKPSINVSETIICRGQNVTLYVSDGNLNNPNTQWNWYINSCGGSYIGSGDSISVDMDSTTTFFVRGESNQTFQSECSYIIIQVRDDQEISISGNLSICQGDTTTLVAGSPICDLPSELKQNLIAYYPFCGNANDLSGNAGNDGIVHGATIASDRFGNPNSAYSFDGNGQYIGGSCNNFPTNKITISLWFSLIDPNGNNEFFGYGGNSCGQSFFGGSGFGGQVGAITTSGHCGAVNCVASVSPLVGWNNWIITSGNSLTKFYLNGVLIHTCNEDYSGTFVSGKEFAFGSISSPSGYVPYSDINVQYLNGLLDDIVIYNEVFDSTQVKTLYDYFNLNSTNNSYLWTPGLQTTASIDVNEEGVYSVNLIDTNGCNSSASVQVNDTCINSVNVKVFIEGFYLGNGVMNSTLVGQPTLCDSITIELHDATFPYSMEHATKSVIDIYGGGKFKFPLVTPGQYFIVIKHRNALETWSSNAVEITSYTSSYDFTDAGSKSYGNNVKDLQDGSFGIYSGDVNQDGAIDSTDFDLIENFTGNFISGYSVYDLTGDNLLESADYCLIENNLFFSIVLMRP